MFSFVTEAGITLPELQAGVGADCAKIGMGPCMKNKWIKKNGDKLVKTGNESDVKDTTRIQLVAILDGNDSSLSEEDLKNLKRRKLVQQVIRKSSRITRGPQYRPQRVKRYADLTKEMLGDKSEVNNITSST